LDQCILNSAGIDWLTLSTTQKRIQSQMIREYGALVEEYQARGFKPEKFGMHGFVGTKIEHAFLLEKDERMLIQITGEAAQRGIFLASSKDAPARLDVQVSVRIAPGAVGRFLNAAERCAQNAALSRGRPPKVQALHTKGGNETVYIGKPASAVRIRCYNKFEESHEERWRDTVRLEVQLRHRAAAAVWRGMEENMGGTRYLIQCLYGYLEQRGIDTSWIPSPWSYVRPPAPLKTALSQREAWWANQVAPGIKEHVAEHGLYRSLQILYGQCLTPDEIRGMLDAAAQSWGN
jgi:hypothetical protein